jgi:membrane associated rhomboid family serine protease
MPNCISCGRELPPTTGTLSALCRDCQAKQDQPRVIPAEILPVRVNATRFLGSFSVTNVLVGLNVAVFAGMLLSGVSLISPTSEQLLRWGANWGPMSLGVQPWRMLTSNYVHIGIIHILLNMWCLVNLGKLAERIFPPWTYVLIYTCCGVGGSLASLWWHPMVVGAGASGAIFGLAGALIGVLYLGHLPIPKEAVRGTLKSLVTFAGYNLFFGLTAGIDNAAHIGGLVTGFVIGAALSRHITALPEVRRQWSNFIIMSSIVALLAGTVWLRQRYPSYQTISSIQPSDLDAGRTGLKALQQGNYDEAILQLQKFVRLNPGSAQAHYLLGLAYVGARRNNDAMASFQQALKLKPDFADAEKGLASAYAAEGMQDKADEALRRAEQMSGH